MSTDFQETYATVDCDETKNAKTTELHSWKVHNVYKEIDMKEATSPLISTRWIISKKEDHDKSTYMKARLVIRGFQDVDKDSVTSESPTAHIESLKAMLALLPTMGFKPKKIDNRSVFIKERYFASVSILKSANPWTNALAWTGGSSC